MVKKPIYELFPERTRRVRRGRGFSADVTIKSTPSNRDFFEALACKLVYYNETLVERDIKMCGLQSTYVDAFYHENDPGHQRYGYIHYGICNCTNCNGLGLSFCQTGKDLGRVIAAVDRYIHWHDNQEVFLVNLCHYTTDMQVITPIVEYFYPYEADKNSALLLQVRLIEQYKEITRERAEARARWRPDPTFYNDLAELGQRVQYAAPPMPAYAVPGAVVQERLAQPEPTPIPAVPEIGQVAREREAGRVNWAERVRQVQEITNRTNTLREAIQQLQAEEDRRIFVEMNNAEMDQGTLERGMEQFNQAPTVTQRVADMETIVDRVRADLGLEPVRRDNEE